MTDNRTSILAASLTAALLLAGCTDISAEPQTAAAASETAITTSAEPGAAEN